MLLCLVLNRSYRDRICLRSSLSLLLIVNTSGCIAHAAGGRTATGSARIVAPVVSHGRCEIEIELLAMGVDQRSQGGPQGPVKSRIGAFLLQD